MDNLLILQCDQEQYLHKLADKIFNMKRFVEMPDTGDKIFEKQKEDWRTELRDIERQKY
jgi:hypothetical protein